jgi:hypothetical protein
MFFQDITFISKPKTKEKVIFQCDENYFVNYGIYNLFSCDNHGHDVHLHLINPSELLIEQIKNLQLSIDLSISTEKLAITDINFYKLKSYYFCSRYFISNLLFEKNLISKAYIVDEDVIFMRTFFEPTNFASECDYTAIDNKTLKCELIGEVDVPLLYTKVK